MVKEPASSALPCAWALSWPGASFYLDTVEGMSNDFWSTEGEDHHQGLARLHRLSDGSIHFFLTHSELDTGDKGSAS